MAKGIMAIEWEVIRDALHLPKDTRLVAVISNTGYVDSVDLIVDHPDIKEIEGPQPVIPILSPWVRHESERFIVNWGQDGTNR